MNMKSISPLNVSLEDVVLVKIGLWLWSHSHKTMELVKNSKNTDDWLSLEKVVYSNIGKLPLPDYFKDKVKFVNSSISLEIFKFTDYLRTRIHASDHLLNYCVSKLCWKSYAVIDKIRTAKVLIEGNALYLTLRYALASIFCLEADSLKLWNQFSIEEKIFFLTLPCSSDHFRPVLSIWSFYNEQEESRLYHYAMGCGYHSICLYQFICSVVDCFPEAVVYYWKKIPREERILAISKAIIILQKTFMDIVEMCRSSGQCLRFYSGSFNEIIVFLFSSEEGLNFLTGESPVHIIRVLLCYMEWPLRENFLSVFEKLQPFFNENDCLQMIYTLERNFLSCRKCADPFYLLVLRDVWKLCSQENKESILTVLLSLKSTYFWDKKLASLLLNDLHHTVKKTVKFPIRCDWPAQMNLMRIESNN